MQSVGVVGLDYSGSTILNGALGVLPGVFAAGESHWIVDRDLGCRECGEDCPVLRPDVLRLLRSSQKDWWGSLRTAAGADVVVSTDKRPQHYKRFGVPDYLVFLHRDPSAHVASRLRRIRQDHASEQDAVTAAVAWFEEHSVNRLKWVHAARKPYVGLSLERFVREPEAVLRSLCSTWGIAFGEEALRFWEHPQHYVGGNFSIGAHKRKKVFADGLRLPEDPPVDVADRISSKVLRLIQDLPELPPPRP